MTSASDGESPVLPRDEKYVWIAVFTAEVPEMKSAFVTCVGISVPTVIPLTIVVPFGMMNSPRMGRLGAETVTVEPISTYFF